MTLTKSSFRNKTQTSNECVNASKKKEGKGLRRKSDTKIDGDERNDEFTLPSKPSYERQTSPSDQNVNTNKITKDKKEKQGIQREEIGSSIQFVGPT